MNVSAFRESFPEFRTASDELVQRKLDEATRFVAPEAFLELTEDAIGYWAAHLLATSPAGISQRLDDDRKESTYKDRYLSLRKAIPVRMLIT